MSELYTIAPPAPQDFFTNFPELHPIILQLMYQRGIQTAEAIEHFLHPDYDRDQHDPWLFKDMRKAVDRILQAKTNNESVVIYGDYDADGVCSTVLLNNALEIIGLNNVQMYLPHRDTEGYGLNKTAIETFISQGVQLIITVDCGISNHKEVTQAKAAGIDVIVTDHHAEPLQLPTDAYAIINPQLKEDNYPFAALAGVGVAFKLAQALGRHLELGDSYEKWLLDLVAISTITDCMPLIDENRVFVKYGLIVLNKTRRQGLQQLITATHSAGTPVTTSSIAYRIGPWINAAGRIDHANMAIALLVETDEAEAKLHTEKLKSTNTSRQQQTEQMFIEAKTQAEMQSEQPILFVYQEDWPLGLVGLVAGKLVSAFHKPAFVMTQNKDGISGSGRSLPGLNMIIVLQQIETLFEKYGGHAMACGFTLASGIERAQFQKEFQAAAQVILEQLSDQQPIAIDAKLSLADINWDLVNQLDLLQPFGEGNTEPIFLLENITIKDFQTVGQRNQHIRCVITDATQTTHKAIGFGLGDQATELKLNQAVRAVCTLGVNQWNGNKEIQLTIKHLEVLPQ